MGWGCRQYMYVNEKRWQKVYMAGVHAQSLSVTFFFICLYLSSLPKDRPTVDCFHSHWSTTPFTCPVLPLFNHLITIVSMQHSLLDNLKLYAKRWCLCSGLHHVVSLSYPTRLDGTFINTAVRTWTIPHSPSFILVGNESSDAKFDVILTVHRR